LSPHSDSYLLQALLNDDAPVIRHIYAQYAKQTAQFIENNNGTRQDAQDVFQEALMTITRQAQRGLVLTCPFGAYLHLICRGKWLNELKRRARNKVTLSATDGFDGMDDAFMLAEQTLRDEAREQLFRQCFEQLPESCRQILQLAWSGISLEEVGLQLNRTYGYIRKRKSDCTGKFFELVQSDPEFSRLK
jgi:RNA polymerase sigma factor (sigma-70 family)